MLILFKMIESIDMTLCVISFLVIAMIRYVYVNHLIKNPTLVKISTGRDNSGVCMYSNIYIFLHH